MPSSAHYKWSTPVLSGENDVPKDLTALASQIDASVHAIETILAALEKRVPFAMCLMKVSASQRQLPYSYAVTFPSDAGFTETPLIFLGRNNTAAATSNITLTYTGESRAGATILFSGINVTQGWCQCNLLAIQMRPTSTTS